MFGYILPDKPNMYMKDYYFYRSFYCGLCKLTGKMYGTLARGGVNYDVTFIDILLHGLAKREYKYTEEVCILNPFQKKSILCDNPISRKVASFNILLLEFKWKDDKRDGMSGKKRIAGRFFKRKAKKARKELPEVAKILDKAFEEQGKAEAIEGISIDRVADPFARAMSDVCRELAGEDYSLPLGNITYGLAKYIYILDAIDDFDSDKKRGEFNPFRNMYPEITSQKELVEQKGDDLNYIIGATIDNINDNYKLLAVFGTEGIITNTLWYGLRAGAKRIMYKEKEKCQEIRF